MFYSIIMTNGAALRAGACCKLKTTEEHMHSDNLSKNTMLVLKDLKLAECLVVSFHVLTLKHKAKHGYMMSYDMIVSILIVKLNVQKSELL